MVGNFSTDVLGIIRYAGGSSGLNPIVVAVPIAVIAVLAVVAIIAIVLIARHRSIKREAHVQKLLIQMDRLEATVAKECKQGDKGRPSFVTTLAMFEHVCRIC